MILNEKCLMKSLLSISFVLGAFLFYFYIYDGTVPEKSSINGKEYRLKDDINKQTKANLLSNLNSKLQILVDSLKNDNSPSVKRLINNWNKGVSIKETGNMEGDAAYVINKQFISVCLKDFVKDVNLENINRNNQIFVGDIAILLISKIKENHFKGIALDVISNETSRNNLLKMVALTEGRNFIITPHIGGATFDSINSTEIFIVEKLLKNFSKR